MNDTYIPGFSNALQHLAVGGRALASAQADYSNPQDYYNSLYGHMQYSPEQQAYIDSVNAYAAAQEGPFGSYVSALPLGLPTETDLLRGNTPAGYTGDVNAINPYMTKPVEQNVNYQFNVPVDSGSGSGLVSVGYDTPVYLVNPKTGEIISSGVGFDAAKDVANKARELSTSQGRKANWEIYTGAPGSTDLSTFTRQAVDDPNKGVLGKIADIGLPLVGTVLAGPLGAALGSAASGTLQGRSLGDILKGAAISGALSSVSGQLFGGGVMGNTFTDATGSALGSTAGSAAGSALGSTAGSALASSIPGQIVVEAGKSILPAVLGGVGLAGAGLAASGALGGGGVAGTTAPTTTGSPITVTGNIAPSVSAGQIVAPVTGALGSVVNGVDTATGEIVAEGRPNVTKDTTLPPLTTFTGDVPLSKTPELSTEVNSGLSTVDKLRLGLLGAGLVSDLAGGSGGGATMPGGLGGGQSPIFSAKLPAANLPAATPRTASDMGNIDYYRYGYGPEQSFFSNVPQGAPNTSKAYTGYEEREGLAMGGQPRSNFAVGGPGDGREDKIPAMLSDGEYVIDAETVAMLGNGSNKAGAKALDSFRVNVRKHKGHKLAKGEFSRDAKRPEQYLKGRK